MKTRAQKEQSVRNITELVNAHPVIAIANITGIPSAQMQQIRKQLAGNLSLYVAKNNLITRTFNELVKAKPRIDGLNALIDGQTVLIASKLDPFKLSKRLEDTKTKIPAKGGELAPEDIEVKAGETEFPPGPIVGELQRAGIPAAIERGKVVIRMDKIVVKEGDKIPRELALALARLKIHPITVGIDLRGVYENGQIFKPDVLRIDEAKTISELALAHIQALNLAMQLGYVTPQTIRTLLTQGYNDAMNLSLNLNIVTKATVELLLRKALTTALGLKTKVKEV